MSENRQVYNIERWDAVLFRNGTDPVPIIYVKPDDKLLKFASDNKDALLVKINNPSSIYGGKSIYGVFAKSSEIPNCRPNFFKKTGLYVIVLQAGWYGYPDCLGTCEIFGLQGGVDAEEPNSPELKTVPGVSSLEKFKESYKGSYSYGMKNPALILVFVGIILLFLSSMFLSKNGDNNNNNMIK